MHSVCLMSEVIPDKYSYNAITEYIDGLPSEDIAVAEQQANALLGYDGRFSRVKEFAAIVPVATHEETIHTVRHAVGQYARQARCHPFTLVLGLNWPETAKDNPRVEKLIEQTTQVAKEAQDVLDVRVLTQQYAAPVIGRIRRDLWNGVLAAGMVGGTIREGLTDIVGMNGDIDLVHMPRQTMSITQSTMHDELAPGGDIGEYMMGWPRPLPMRHSASPSHPRSSAVMAWNDWLHRVGHVPYEAGMVMSMGRFAFHNGISADMRTREVVDLWSKAGEHPSHQTFIPTGAVVTSGRRFMWRLLDVEANEVWDGDTFGEHSAYRRSVEHFPDISQERQVELIAGTSERMIRMFERGARYNLAQSERSLVSEKRVWRRVGRMLLTAERMLPRIVGEEWRHEEPFATARKVFDEKLAFVVYDQ